jgi:hypothetical protein
MLREGAQQYQPASREHQKILMEQFKSNKENVADGSPLKKHPILDIVAPNTQFIRLPF